MQQLSIIIPYYKRAFFEATLDSLANQTNKCFKVFIGDDASPEDPTIILKKFEGQFIFEYHRFNQNLGGNSLVKQWNRCIDFCGNDSSWIMILGDDDVLGANVVEEFYNNIENINNLNLNVVKFSTLVIDENNNPISKIYVNKKNEKATDALCYKLLNKNRSSLSEHVFRKSIYKQIGFKEYDLVWHSDDMAWLEFSNFSNLYCITDEKVYIRVTDKCISGNIENNIIKNKATLNFFSDLVFKYLIKFNFFQRNLILRLYESNLIKVKGKSKNTYLKIFWLYFKNAYLFSVVRFTYRYFLKLR